jgi:hypothetical protein
MYKPSDFTKPDRLQIEFKLHRSIVSTSSDSEFTRYRCNVFFENIKKIELYRTDEDGGFEIDSDGEEE